MPSGPDDLDYYVDIPDVDDLFNVPWRTRILTDRSGRGYRRWGQIPQPVYLIGRPITSSTQTPDSIVDINGRLKVTGGFGNSAAIATGSILSGTEPIGDLFFLRKVAAGNVSCLSNTTLLGVGVAIYQLLQANYYIATDSTVATRTPANPKINTAFNASAVVTDFNLGALPSLTASQEGSITLFGNPMPLQVNTNGTITTGATSPLPAYFDGSTTVISAPALTAGVAGDTHILKLLCRRVA